MNWRERLVAYALDRKLASTIFAEGIDVEFADGCDVFWVLPGEVTSSVPVSEPQPDVARLIEEFERIDRLRTLVLHVIRHDLAARGIYVDRSRSGEWSVMADIVSSSICVGPALTSRAVEERDFYRVVAACYEHSILGEPPSRTQIDRYLAIGGPPPMSVIGPTKPPVSASGTLYTRSSSLPGCGRRSRMRSIRGRRFSWSRRRSRRAASAEPCCTWRTGFRGSRPVVRWRTARSP